MLIFFKQNLAFLSVPKTGSTAYEQAIRRRADVIFSKSVKHMTAGKFHAKVVPFLKSSFDLDPESVAVVRDPIDHARSWYKYRSPERMSQDDPACHGGVSFDEFVLDAISDAPSRPARIGSQANFLALKTGEIGAHHLFSYDRLEQLQAFLTDRFEEPIEPRAKNVSPFVEAEISREVAARFRVARPAEFALYDRVIAAGGVLRAFGQK